MTEELSERDLTLLKPYLKLIDTLSKENAQLGMEVDTLRYNKRYTNTKYVKADIASPTFIPAATTGITYVQEQTKLKRRNRK